jgi:putative hydrolase of the HAD superfamily
VPLKAVVFDLDDTLYSERTYVESGMGVVGRHLAELLGEPKEVLVQEMLSLLDTHGRGRVFDRLLARRGSHDAQLVARLVDVYRQHTPEIRLERSAPEVLARLREIGLKLGVLTDGLCVMQRNKLAALGVLNLIDAAICTDELGGPAYWKPNPIGFQKLLDALHVRADEALFVGNDPNKDMTGAQAVGMLAAQLAPADAVVAPGVFLVSRLSDVIPLVLRHGAGIIPVLDEDRQACANHS